MHRLQVCDVHEYGKCNGTEANCSLRWVCHCQTSDAWRCACLSNRSDVIACECACHKVEPIVRSSNDA